MDGDNFTPLDYSGCRAVFAGVEADSCSMIHANQILATWDLGVPSVEDETMPLVSLLHTDGQSEMNVINPELGGIAIPLLITGEQAGLTCSFAGGCVHTITA